MTTIADSRRVARVLEDPRYLVPEADAAATAPFDAFRRAVSRFANGPVHVERRADVDALLARLNLDEVAALAGARARRARSTVTTPTLGADTTAAVARTVPVAALGEALGFADPDALPAWVATVADRYATGRATDASAEDAAIERLLAAAPGRGPRVLEVQLLIQSWASTAALIEGALRRSAASGIPQPSTGELLTAALEDAPVAVTRRVARDGELVELSLAGGDLAFGWGPRRCPAPHHALAIAAAVVDELRDSRDDDGRED
jgi:cytochrome P450